MDVDLESLTRTSGEWLKATGPDSDIVMSSRIRLARNLAQFPFPSRADDSVRAEVDELLKTQLAKHPAGRKLNYIVVSGLELLDRQMLVERQLISREHSESHGQRGVGISDEENVSIMVNEEDHLRIQVLRSGFALDDCWQEINAIDDAIEADRTYAFSDRLGYLTACPTNCGTGIRVSVLMHLPGLVHTKEITKVFQALQKINLAVRGLYGEGSQAMGDFYQISNQVTLGKSEEQLIRTIKDVVPNIVSYERRVRQELVSKNRRGLHDQVSRAYGIL
ncbi:MAG: ATP--guanido phosphotransferase, partial [Planctomycetota bacterium]